MRFREPRDALKELELPCGQCIGCRLRRSQEWTLRLMHEKQMHPDAAFITLTYDEEHYRPGLVKEDLQKFLKRFRKRMGKSRYYAAGEYGAENARPHWHVIMFGPTLTRGPMLKEKPFPIYESPDLKATWKAGNANYGDVTEASCAYVAKYALKKRTGKQAEEHYRRVDPETGEIFKVPPERGYMSQSLGKTWFEKYWTDVYLARDGVPGKGGKVTKAPRMYDKLLKELNSDLWEEKQLQRYEQAAKAATENTPERLAQREAVAKAREALNRRNKI